MTKPEWGAIVNFTPAEFDSADKPGSGEAMQYEFVRILDKVRDRLGAPLKINSGFRTRAHNAAIGGRKNSAHLRGWAADLDLTTLAKAMKKSVPAARHALLEELFFFGVTRFGIYETFVHADMDPALPENVMWMKGE